VPAPTAAGPFEIVVDLSSNQDQQFFRLAR
jgi:hypothetical protein